MVLLNIKSKSRIAILHTGGTFGMTLLCQSKVTEAQGKSSTHTRHGSSSVSLTKTKARLQPDSALHTLFSFIPELKQLADLDFHVLMNKDSSDMGPDDWILLTRFIKDNQHNYDAFVVIHGTDTMAYTASALSYFFAGFSKPIVLTGSQRPLTSLRTDARLNIINAVEFAALNIPLVSVCFHNSVYLGTRITKQSNNHMQAFTNFQGPVLAEFGVDIKINQDLLTEIFKGNNFKNSKQKNSHGRVPDFLPDTRHCPEILSLNATPGFAPDALFSQTVVKSFKGVLVRAFGTGNLPVLNKPWWEWLVKSTATAKIPLVIHSQSAKGPTTLDAYENGRRYLKAGVLSSLDMSLEAATLKLMIMLGRTIPQKSWQSFYASPLAWECESAQGRMPS